VILGGTVGGPWQALAWTWPKVHAPYSTQYDVAFDAVRTRIRCGKFVEVEGSAIRNPVTGAEAYPGVVLPQGIIFKHAELGATSRFRVSNGIEYDYSGQYMAIGPYEYAWP
jgi:hypothetical protein